MNTIWVGLIGMLAGPVAAWIFGIVLPNGAVKAVGVGVGKVCTVFLRQRIGKNWEPVEKHLQGTISSFIAGLYEGLDFDDER